MSQHDISVLNSLTKTTLDSVKGFRDASEDVNSSRYGQIFAGFAQERSAVATQLQQEVTRLGGTPETETSLLAAAHRGFMNLKDALMGSDDKAIVDEVERGEDHIKAKFEAALRDEGLMDTTRRVIETAYGSVKAGHDRARDLKHGLAASSAQVS